MASNGLACIHCDKGLHIRTDVLHCDDILIDHGFAEDLTKTNMTTSILFDRLYEITNISHPLCVDCCQSILYDHSMKISEQTSENLEYKERLQVLDNSLDDTLSDELEELERELSELENESVVLDNELHHSLNLIHQQHLESCKIELITSRFENQCTELEHKVCKFREDVSENIQKQHYTQSLMRHWEICAVYLPDAFIISQDGDFGTINNLHLGTCSKLIVDWDEINAAWGYTIGLLNSMAKRRQYTFKKYRLIPRGSSSIIERFSDRRCLELFGSKEITFYTIFWYSQYNEALEAFLDCLREFCEFAETNDRNLRIRYKMKGHVIGKYSIKYEKLGSNIGWVRAQRLVLENLKRLQNWEICLNDNKL